MALEDVGNYTEIHTNVTTTIISAVGAGVPPVGILLGLFVNNPGTTWQAIVYDGTAAQNVIVATLGQRYFAERDLPSQAQDGPDGGYQRYHAGKSDYLVAVMADLSYTYNRACRCDDH